MDGILAALITDGVCSYFMKKKMIDMVVAARIELPQTVMLQKIGTYTVAIAVKYHNIPFYIAVSLSTIDTSTKTGDDIIIEQRSCEEAAYINGKIIYAPEVDIINL